tara:strand:+ start:101 stop:457 length:357 start_codon:yes stop_codon:yes gene_type:complete
MSIDYQELTGKLITENSELKNQLSDALQELEDIYNAVESEPNDMALGEIVRQHYWMNTEDTEEEPVSRERAEARLQYLKTELAHESYHDGWTLKGMKEEVEWLESQLNGKQMELFDNH